MDHAIYDSSSVRGSSSLARRACRYCSRRKIRCSKELPECSSCKVHKQTCSYAKQSTSGFDTLTDVLTSTQAAHEPNLALDEDEKALAAIRFLDNELFLRSLRGAIPSLRVTVCIPDYVKQLVFDGDSSQRIVTSYYQSVHPWLPIVSKRKVFERLLNPLLPARVDSAFLLLCMRILVSSCTGINNPDVFPEYHAAIRYCMEIQRSGLMTPEILQGCILLSVYEWGHAIYPAADLSMSVCLRYALSLEMGWEAARGEASKSMWADEEEERRTWWAVYILERIAGLGRPQQIMLVPEAEMSATLPCNDNDWENQTTPKNYYTLSSPPESLGRYASAVQASYLLSCVYHHKAITSISVSSHLSELDQLDKTLGASIRYSAQTQPGGIYSILCYQTAISFCAILILYAPYLQKGKPSDFQQRAKKASENAALIALSVARGYLEKDPTSLGHGDIPPFTIPWLYMAGIWFILEGSVSELKMICDALRKIDIKWKSAGRYLQFLSARKAIMHE